MRDSRTTPDPTPDSAPAPPDPAGHRRAPTARTRPAGHRPGRAARWGRRTAATSMAAGAAVVLSAGMATAHVTVTPSTSVGGADEVALAFRVPSEQPTASTTRVAITLPVTQPFADVQARPVPGWTVTVVDAQLAVPVVDDAGTTLTRGPHVITWTAAAGSGIPPGQYQEFDVYAGPLPRSGTEVFTATQTYSDGTVVAWDQVAKAGAAEPDDPAPSFAITPATSAPAGVDHTARVLAGTGLAVGVLGLGAAAAALTAGRRRRRPSPVRVRTEP